MAEDKTGRKPRVRKAPLTVREKAEKELQKAGKVPRRRKVARVAATPFKKAAAVGRKEYHPIKLPDSKLGRFLTRSRRFIPRYFRNSWEEVKQVNWPNRRNTFKLTLAVFVFVILFGTIITLADFGLDKLFRRILL